jgi:hypothetical protein
VRVTWLGDEWDMVTPPELLVAEQVAIEKHIGGPLEDMTSMQTVLGLVYVTIRRHLPQFSWKSLESLTRTEFDDLMLLDPEEQELVDAARGDDGPPAPAPGGAPSTNGSDDTSSNSATSSDGTPETSTV